MASTPRPARKGTSVRLVVDGEDVEEVESMEYSSDVLAVPDYCQLTVANIARKYRDRLKLGQEAEVHMANPAVNDGEWTLRFSGIITNRSPSGSKGTGNRIDVTVGDLGWHLTGGAPLWYNLKKASYSSLVDPASPTTILDSSFKFKGVRFDNDINKRAKLGLAAVRAEQSQLLQQVYAIQVEPGQTYLSIITDLCRRYNLLVNTSLDGVIQCFLPKYDETPLYIVRNGTESGIDDAVTNVKSYRCVEDAGKIFTRVQCVGEQVGGEILVDSQDPNATKRRGAVDHPGALPFRREFSFSDSEAFNQGLAQKVAEWRYKRFLFDAYHIQYTVPDHFQIGSDGKGVWYDCDHMVDVTDYEVGYFGGGYLRAVKCRMRKNAPDETDLIIHKPGLLTAAFGVLPAPPLILANNVKGTPKAEGT